MDSEAIAVFVERKRLSEYQRFIESLHDGLSAEEEFVSMFVDEESLFWVEFYRQEIDYFSNPPMTSLYYWELQSEHDLALAAMYECLALRYPEDADFYYDAEVECKKDFLEAQRRHDTVMAKTSSIASALRKGEHFARTASEGLDIAQETADAGLNIVLDSYDGPEN